MLDCSSPSSLALLIRSHLAPDCISLYGLALDGSKGGVR